MIFIIPQVLTLIDWDKYNELSNYDLNQRNHYVNQGNDFHQPL